MITLTEYLNNPCGNLSIPYWKAKNIVIPLDMQILHDKDFSANTLSDYTDEKFFRLYHNLKEIPKIIANDFEITTATRKDIKAIVQIINDSYTDISVNKDLIKSYTKTPVYNAELWIMVKEKATNKYVGCGIADFDTEAKELILEWIQVLPQYRGKKIGQLIVTELLFRMKDFADFATVSGSGTLQSSDAEAIEIPSSVTVTSYTVKNGQSVKKGDVIAKVDKKSVQNAIYETQKLIDEMDEEIADVKSDTVSSKITARADGRVKAIYAEKGKSVSSAMYDKGALIVISLGGSMSVDVSTEKSVKTGQTVSVTLSDGKKIEGKIQQVKNKKITVTVTDNGTVINDTVTVSSQNGTVLGKGKLYVSSPLNVTGYAGTVKSIHVSVGDKVSAGDTLLTLENPQDKSRYQQLLREREDLTDLVSTLSQMYKDGTIKAEGSGVVSRLSNDIGYTELEKVSDESTVASNVSYNTDSNSSSSIKPMSLSVKSTNLITTLAAMVTETEPSSEVTKPSQPMQPTQQPTMPDNSKNEPTTEQGGNFNPPSQTQQQKDGKYAGIVTKVSYGVLYVNINQTDMTGKDISALEKLGVSAFTAFMQYTPDSQIPVYMYKDGKATKSSVGAIQSSDKVYIYIKDGAVSQIDYIPGTQKNDQTQGAFPNTDSNQNTPPEMNFSGGTNQGNANTEGFPSGSFTGGNMQMPSGNGSFFGQQSTTEEEEEATYIVEKTTLYAITPAETMSIKVSVDELDVVALKEGQTANITLDALPGQSVKGTVEKLSAVGSSEEGGAAKYTATITVSRIDEMLDGMNASIVIETSTQENVLTIPAAAVYEEGIRTFVYTSIGSGEEELKNPVDIITGTSDGTNIEVLEGLSEGDAVYYSYADSVTYSLK